MAVIASPLSWISHIAETADTSVPLIWIILSTIIIPSLVSLLTLYLTSRKDKAKINTDQSAMSLEWTKAFWSRLDAVEKENDETKRQEAENRAEIQRLLVSNLEACEQIAQLQKDKREMSHEIDALKQSNISLLEKMNKIEKENIILRKRVKELEEENKLLKKGDGNV